MKYIPMPPAAPALLNSLRAIGYSFEAALADIVDNSVAAEATLVNIQFRTAPSPYIAIMDNGRGMSTEGLIAAMKHGGDGPERSRGTKDLGRFGLGLKTATLSQCRRLTVVSLTAGEISGACWDLDIVEAHDDWSLGLLSEEDVDALPHVDELRAAGQGTIVFWEEFDRATAGETSGDKAIGELLDEGRNHLAMAFHRYLAGEDGSKLTISINNTRLKAYDPFLAGHTGTRKLPLDIVRVSGEQVAIQPYILPHLSKLTKAQVEQAGGEEGLRRSQGFYIYRNRRLITHGTWFRLVRQEELTKLARVQIDIPNSLDHLWALDVKKSAAHPPEAIRTELRRVVERITGSSREVFRFRGRRSTIGEVTHVWDRTVLRDGIDYVVNRDHPLVVAIREALPAGQKRRLDHLLRVIEISLPTDSLYADLASERSVQNTGDAAEMETFLRELLDRLMEAAGTGTEASMRLLAGIQQIEPFSSHPSITYRILESIQNVR